MEIFDVNCPACDTALELPESLFGKKCICPGCEKIIEMPVLKIQYVDTPKIPLPPEEKIKPKKTNRFQSRKASKEVRDSSTSTKIRFTKKSGLSTKKARPKTKFKLSV